MNKILKFIALITLFTFITPTAGVFAANYIGNINSYKFHRITCRTIKRMNPNNRIDFNTREEAINYGMTPCKICKP